MDVPFCRKGFGDTLGHRQLTDNSENVKTRPSVDYNVYKVIIASKSVKLDQISLVTLPHATLNMNKQVYST